MSKFVDLTGQVFGELTTIEMCGKTKNGKTIWLCKCSCGRLHKATIRNLRAGVTTRCRHCACLSNHRKSKHGKIHSRLYSIWRGMRRRCDYPHDKKYYLYGAKGITVCDEWNKNFMSFYNWAMQNGYADNLTLDRIDNSKGYCPENCRWATTYEQQMNRCNTVLITHNGETKPLLEWCKIYQYNYQSAISRKIYLSHKGINIFTLEMLFKPTKMHQQGVPFEQHSS